MLVEPEGFDDYARSLREGRIVANATQSGSICDALMAVSAGAIGFALNRASRTRAVAVSDAEALAAVAFAFHELKLVVEPGGAVALAALLSGRLDVAGKTVAVVLSGGNIDAELLHRALARGSLAGTSAMAELITTLGPKRADELGVILPHEHVFVDLRTPDTPGYAEAEAADVIALMVPEIERVKALGVTALVECSTGRRRSPRRPRPGGLRGDGLPDRGADRHLPRAVGAALGAPGERGGARRLDDLASSRKGSRRAACAPAGSSSAPATTGSPRSRRRSSAPRRAPGAQTGAVIGSHTIRGRVVMDQLDDHRERAATRRTASSRSTPRPSRTSRMHLAVARRGAWIEYDGIGGWGEDADYVENIHRVLDAGFGDRLLLSQDRGWFDPAQPGGGTPKPYTYLMRGLPAEAPRQRCRRGHYRQLTRDNPFRAFAR